MEHKIIADGITFDDVLLIPRRSGVLPSQADTSSQLTRRIRINIPLVSAPMDTVTESALAIALAQDGGIGFVHKNLSVEDQAREVRQVKRSENGVINDPVTLAPDQTVADALEFMEIHSVSGFPITADGTGHARLVGILTRRDTKFLESTNARIADVMTSEHLVTAREGTTLDEAKQILSHNKVQKLPLVNGEGCLAGMITMRDIDNLTQHPLSCRDERGRLRVGAAMGVHDYERAQALVDAEADVLVVDTAHGHSENVIATVKALKEKYDVEIVAGNIATTDAARDLIEAGVDAVKVGIGPGSICTTRVVTGVGVPQITAIFNACAVADSASVPVIADGGVRSSGDIAKAIAAGASAVMMGSLFSGLDESPGELVIRGGRRYKTYRGMGSSGAMAQGSADRYGQDKTSAPAKFVPEGVEGLVPYRGALSDFVYQMVGGVRAAMGYCGCSSIERLRAEARFCKVSMAGLVESHPHNITITREAPNYSVEMQRDHSWRE